MKGKKALNSDKAKHFKAVGTKAKEGFVEGAKDSFKKQGRGIRDAAIPALAAGSVAGSLAARKDAKMEKAAASMATKRMLVKARKGGRNAVATGKDQAGKAFNKLKSRAGMNPGNYALGAAIGGTAAYKGAKQMEREGQAARRAKANQ